MKQKSFLSKRLIWAIIATLVVAAVIIVIAVNASAPKIKRVALEKVTDDGWVYLTDVLDRGGAALQQDGKECVLVLGRSPVEGQTDYRLMDVSISKEQNSRDETVCVISLKTNAERTGLKKLSDGANAVSMIENNFRPLAVYRLKTPAGTEVVELRVDGVSASFLSVFSGNTKLVK